MLLEPWAFQPRTRVFMSTLLSSVIGSFFALMATFSLAQDGLFQQQYRPIPGGIPLQYGALPASDLVYRGKVLLPQEAHQLFLQMQIESNGNWTLADLDPKENDLWRNSSSSPTLQQYDDDQKINLLPKTDEVDFTSYSLTRSENYRFTVDKNDRTYQLYIGPLVHNFLVRKNLLRKLGYQVPAIKYLNQIKIHFASIEERDNFLLDFQGSIGRDIERWITSKPKDKNFIVVQDLIAMEDQQTLPNLAIGYLSEDFIDNKRIFRSLLLPYALTDLPESINMFSWGMGQIVSQNVILPYEYSEDFLCSADDARWMATRLLKLSEADWHSIAFESHLPAPVARLLFEKLKSRRNFLSTLFQIPTFHFDINSTISDPDFQLKEGEIQQEFFPGYGRRFKIPDPDSPLSFSEVSAMLKSMALTEGMELATGALNNYLRSDLSGNISKINQEIGEKAKVLINNGESLKSLVKGYTYPTVGGSISVSREIVAGSYLGTNNLIQVVDTIGAGVNAGMYAGLAGVYAQTGTYVPSLDGRAFLPVSLGATAGLNLNRTYAHIRPITSIQKALKEPFKNLMVPIMKRKKGKKLEELASTNLETLIAEEKQEELKRIFQAVNEHLAIGDSLIITDYAGIGLGAEVGMSLYQIVDLRARAAANTIVLSRLHILRKSETIVQIYKDFGNSKSVEIALGVSKFIPLAKVRIKGARGRAQTKFYSVILSPQNKQFQSTVSALGQVLKQGSLQQLNAVSKPFVFHHRFKERDFRYSALVFNHTSLFSGDKIKVTSPKGESKSFYRGYSGKSKGINYADYSTELISLLASKIVNTNFTPINFTDNAAGYSFYGKAFNKVATLEAEVTSDGQMVTPYLKVNKVWNGWRIKQKKALSLLKQIKNDYQFNFVPEEVLAQTSKIFLYSFNVSLYVHKEGINALESLSEEEIKAIFKQFQRRDNSSFKNDDALVLSGVKRFIANHQRYLKHKKSKNHKRATKSLLRCLEIIDDKINTQGHDQFFGSRQNYLITFSLDGFRVGDERGDETINGNMIGSIGNEQLRSPIGEMMEFLRQASGDTVVEGEFFINWILGRII